MIIGVDIETEGLDATKFICGSIVNENGKKEFFTDRKSMWERILEMGEAERKRKRRLHVYGHNGQYDYYGYANLKDTEVTIESLNPMIITRGDRKEIIFLDSSAIFKMELKELGESIGLKKMEMPKSRKPEELKEYNIRDAEIVARAIRGLKRRLSGELIGCKTLISAGQIASKYLLNEIRTSRIHSFFDEQKDISSPQRYMEKTRKGYRGARKEALELGFFSKATLIDANSMYPYACTLIPFPNLKTEELYTEPKNHAMNLMGTTTALIEKESEGQALLGIRMNGEAFYPTQKCMMFGTWTNIEIEEARKSGYKIIRAYETIGYETEETNPIGEAMQKLYKLRKSSGNAFDNIFYKTLMNHSIGKFAQEREYSTYRIDLVSKAEKYLEEGWETAGHMGYHYIYKKKGKKTPYKFYAAIIPAYVNAMTRIILFNAMRKSGKGNTLYYDTDGMLLKDLEKAKGIEIGNEMGQWKIKGKDKEALIYAKNSYMFDDKIMLSGVSKAFLSKEDFIKGKMRYARMNSIIKGDSAGKFTEYERDLLGSMAREMERQEREKETIIFIDDEEENKAFAAEECSKAI